MGTYTAHWKQHKRRSIQGLIYVLLWFLLALPATAVICLGVDRLTREYPGYLHAGLLLVWLIVFTAMVLRFAKVTCPKCNARYSHGKWVTSCPECGLKIGQEEP